MQDPNADTQWNDALRKHGIIPAKEKEITEADIIALAEDAIDSKTKARGYDDMDLDEMDDLEDDVDEEDERAFAMYRQQRLAEMQAVHKASCFGSVLEISKPDWVTEVNKAGEGIWVVIQIYKPGSPTCAVFNKHLSSLAQKFPRTKFIKSEASVCFDKPYPDHNLPTMFLYHEGDMKKSWVGPACGNINVTEADLEWRLHSVGALQSTMKENPRQDVADVMTSAMRAQNDNDDNDW